MSIPNHQPPVKEQRQQEHSTTHPTFIGRSRRWLGWAVAVVVLAVLAAGPSYLNLYTLSLGFTLFTFMILALSWNLLGGTGDSFRSATRFSWGQARIPSRCCLCIRLSRCTWRFR